MLQGAASLLPVMALGGLCRRKLKFFSRKLCFFSSTWWKNSWHVRCPWRENDSHCARHEESRFFFFKKKDFFFYLLCLIFWKGVLFANDVNRERISALTSNIHRMVRFFFSFSLLWFNFWRVLPTRLFPTWTRLPSLEWLEVLIVFCWMHHALVWVWLFATPESRYCFCLCMSAFVYWPFCSGFQDSFRHSFVPQFAKEADFARHRLCESRIKGPRHHLLWVSQIHLLILLLTLLFRYRYLYNQCGRKRVDCAARAWFSWCGACRHKPSLWKARFHEIRKVSRNMLSL